MEVFLFALFFISTLIFFISGKDDFGRTESKLIIKEETKVKDEEKKEQQVAEKGNIEPIKEIKEETMIKDEEKKEQQVAEKENIEPIKEIKKDS